MRRQRDVVDPEAEGGGHRGAGRCCTRRCTKIAAGSREQSPMSNWKSGPKSNLSVVLIPGNESRKTLLRVIVVKVGH